MTGRYIVIVESAATRGVAGRYSSEGEAADAARAYVAAGAQSASVARMLSTFEKVSTQARRAS